MNKFEFGFELQLAGLAIALLLTILLVLRVRKRISKKAKPKKGDQTSALVMQAEESILAAEPLSDAGPNKEPVVEAQADAPLCCDEPFVETSAAAIPQKLDNLPQDSMLRRHALANLRVMIESLKPPRPTDSTLCRHYDTMLIAEIGQCLTDKAAMERLICNYEDHKKVVARQIQEPKAIAEPLAKAGVGHEDAVAPPKKPKSPEDSGQRISKKAKPKKESFVETPADAPPRSSGPSSGPFAETPATGTVINLPQDSMLRRHAITQLYAQVEANMPPRPTDSVLRRHYDTMVDNEVKKRL